VPAVPALPAPSTPALPAPVAPAPAPTAGAAPNVGAGTSEQPRVPAQAPSAGAANGTARESWAAPPAAGAAQSGGSGGSGGSGTAGSPSAPSAPSDAQVRRRDHRLRTAVRRLRGCLPALPRLQRRVLVLRTGIGKGGPRSRERVARILDRSEPRVGRIERRAVRRLEAAERSGRCAEIERASALTAPDGDASEVAATLEGSLVDAAAGGAGGVANALGGGAAGGDEPSGGKGGDGKGRSGVKGESREGDTAPGVATPLNPPPDITLAIIGLMLLAGAVLAVRGIRKWMRDSAAPPAS
jgi:hypothetical protein